MPDNNPTLMSGIFFVSANSRADCADSREFLPGSAPVSGVGEAVSGSRTLKIVAGKLPATAG